MNKSSKESLEGREKVDELKIRRLLGGKKREKKRAQQSGEKISGG